MTTEVSCVITGCGLLDTAHNRWAHGDLWESGDSWIFNAVMDDGRETRWTPPPPDAANRKHLIIVRHSQPFERRGVLVVPKRWCVLSQLASEYIFQTRA